MCITGLVYVWVVLSYYVFFLVGCSSFLVGLLVCVVVSMSFCVVVPFLLCHFVDFFILNVEFLVMLTVFVDMGVIEVVFEIDCFVCFYYVLVDV